MNGDPVEALRARLAERRRDLLPPEPATRPEAAAVARAMLGQQKGVGTLASHRDCWLVVYCRRCSGAVAVILHTAVGWLWVSRADVRTPEDDLHHAVWLDEEHLAMTGAPYAKCSRCSLVSHQNVGPTPQDAVDVLVTSAEQARTQKRRARRATGAVLGESQSMPSTLRL